MNDPGAVTIHPEQLLTWVTLVVAVVGAVVAVGRWTVRAIRRIVDDATRPIQPGANGGGSLPDVVRSLESMARANDKAHSLLHDRIDGLSGDVRELQNWAGGRPYLLDERGRLQRARQALRETREAGSGDDPGCEHVDDQS